MYEIPAEYRMPIAVALFGVALIFCVTAYLHMAPALGMFAGICLVSAARIGYAVAREQGFLVRLP
jgi:hypothetical protein